jgi:hypothetical protein
MNVFVGVRAERLSSTQRQLQLAMFNENHEARIMNGSRGLIKPKAHTAVIRIQQVIADSLPG